MVLLIGVGIIALYCLTNVDGQLEIQSDCPIQGQVYHECAPCYATCSRPFKLCRSEICNPGCGCPLDEVVDTVSKKCIKRTRCPFSCGFDFCVQPICAPGAVTTIPPGQCCSVCACQIGNKVYQVGESFKKDCNDCTCIKSGHLLCGTQKCPGVTLTSSHDQ